MSLSIRVVGCLETLDWSLAYFGVYQPAPLCNQWVREVLLTKFYPIRNNFTGGNCVISCLLKNELFRVRGFGPGWLQGLILIILDHTSRSQVCTSILGALCTPSYHKVYYDIILMKHNIFNKHWFSSHMLSIPPDLEGVRYYSSILDSIVSRKPSPNSQGDSKRHPKYHSIITTSRPNLQHHRPPRSPKAHLSHRTASFLGKLWQYGLNHHLDIGE